MPEKKNRKRDLEALIFAKKSGGASQKGIARDLGISEWQVRCILRKNTTHKVQEKVHNRLRLRKVSVAKSSVKRAIILSDIHIPHHDQAALALALAYTADAKPDVIVLNGDIADFNNVSKYSRDPHEITTFSDELTETRDFLRLVREQHPDAEIKFTVGNHEIRLERYLLNQAPELSSLPELSISSLLHLEEFGIDYFDYSDKIKLGDLEVFHGEIVKTHSGESARAHMLKRGGSVLIGHVHKLGVVYKTDRWGEHVAAENGHLSSPDPSYMVDPVWNQGFSEVHYDENTGQFSIRQHHIRKGRLVVNGKVYSVK